MANLDERIAEWRRACAEAMGGSAEALEELEGHLRDDVARRLAAGAALDEAFAAATQRLGKPAALASEFARGAPAPWLPVRVALIALLVGGGCVTGMLTPRLADNRGALLAVHVVAVTLGYAVTLLIGTLAACYVLARPFGMPGAQQLQTLLSATRRLTIAALILTGLGVVLGGVWAQENLGRFWGWDPKETGGAAVVLWDAVMLVVLTRRLLGDHVTALLGLAGNAVVALAWFGPHVLGQGLHAYGWANGGWWLALWLVAQVGLAALGLLPLGVLRRRRNAVS